MMRKHWPVLAVGIALLGASYAWFDFQARHGEAALLARAQQYWEARRVNDLYTAYYLEAETVNGQLSPDEVEVRREWGQRLHGFKLGPVEYYGDHAEIEVFTDYTIREFTLPVGGGTHKDLWTFMKGQWYHGGPEKGGAGIRLPGSAQPMQPANPTEPAPAPAAAQ